MLTPKWQRHWASEILSKHLSETRQSCQGPPSRGRSLSVLLIQPQVSTLLHLSFHALSEFQALLNLISGENFMVEFSRKLHPPKKKKAKKSEEKLIQFHVLTSLQSLASSCHKFISLQKPAWDTSYVLNQSQNQHKLPFIHLEYRLVAASSATASYHVKLLILFNLKQYKKLTKL